MKHQLNTTTCWQFYLGLILLSFPVGSNARDLILITYHQAESLAVRTAQIMEEQTGIPQDLIQLRQTNHPCTPQRQTIWHVCLTDEGHLKILHQNSTVLQRSFAIFKPPKMRQLNQPPPWETQDLLQRLKKLHGNHQNKLRP